MKLTTKQIAEMVGGELHGDETRVITAAAGIREATSTDVSFVFNPKYMKHLTDTQAGLLFVAEDIALPESTYIIVKNPMIAYAKILEIIESEIKPPRKVGIHQTAIVPKSAKIGKDVFIGPYCVLEDNVTVGDNVTLAAQCFVGHDTTIGADCQIYAQVTIREKTIIGKRVIMHSGTVIGSDGFGFVPGKEGHYKIPQLGHVQIDDDVEIGSNVTIDRATTGKTHVGAGTKIDNLVQVAHNVQIGKHCFIVANAAIAGSAILGDFVTIAGQAGVAGHLTVGDGATVAGQAAVISDVGPKEIVSGYPARPHREAMKVYALTQKLPDMYEEIKHIRKLLLKDTNTQ